MGRRLARRVLAFAIGAASMSTPWPANAGDIRISGGDCGAAVHLVARGVPLSDVLEQLSRTLHFELVGNADRDMPVSIDLTGRPIDLAARLGGLENMSVTLEDDPRCRARERIVKLWVLPRKEAAPARATAAQAEQARREQEGIDMVLRAHGMPASGSRSAKPR